MFGLKIKKYFLMHNKKINSLSKEEKLLFLE